MQPRKNSPPRPTATPRAAQPAAKQRVARGLPPTVPSGQGSRTRPARQQAAQHVARPEIATTRRIRLMPLIGKDGETLCVICRKPNDPTAPKSPYCAEHRQEARKQSVKKSRADTKAIDQYAALVTHGDGEFDDGVHAGTRGTVLLADKMNELRAALGELASAHLAARSVTDGYKAGNTAEFYRTQLVALATAVENANEVLGPALRRPAR